MTLVQDAGTGDLLQLRATDADVVKCRHRYSIFKVRTAQGQSVSRSVCMQLSDWQCQSAMDLSMCRAGCSVPDTYLCSCACHVGMLAVSVCLALWQHD